MRALRLHATGDLRLHEEPATEPADGDLLLHTTAVGLCGSDRHWLLDGGIGDATLTRPLVLGHEFVATIGSGPRAGERVAVDPAIPCERCPVCLAGRSHLCPSMQFAGHGFTDGALRTSMTWPERLVHGLPDSLSDSDGTLLEPLGVALHALDLGKIRPGMRVGVLGCGPLGLLLVRALRMSGVTTLIATDVLPHRVEAALAMGATSAFLPERERLLSESGAGLDVAFEVSGSDDALDDAIASLAPATRVVIVGIPDDDRTSFSAAQARRKGLTMLLARRMKATDLQRAIAVVDAGWLSLDDLVSERHGLDDWSSAFEALRQRRGLKVVIEPQRRGEMG